MNFRKQLLKHRGSNVFESKSGSLFIQETEAASVAVVVLHEGKVVLVKQFRHQLDEQTFELPGGGLESDEEPLHGAKRELYEETGIEAERFTYLGTFHPQRYFTNRHTHLFFTDTISRLGDQHLDDDEEIDVLHLSVDEIFRLIKDGKIQDSELGYALFLCQLNGLISGISI